MPTIGIVLPTIRGREAVFERTYAAFEESCPEGWVFDIIVPEDYPTVGAAWNAGVTELLDDGFDGDYVFLAIDDAEPHPGWADVAVRTVDAGYIPAPRMLFPDGTVESCGTMGFGALLPEAPDCTPCRNTGIIFMRREWWEEIGMMPERHYAIDDLWCWKAMLKGHHVLYRSGMVFTHHHVAEAATDRIRVLAQEHIAATLADMTELRLPGSAFAALADPPVPVVLS